MILILVGAIDTSIITITVRVGRTGQIVLIVPVDLIIRSTLQCSLSRRGPYVQPVRHRDRCGGQDKGFCL